ncbi:hypothetical protein SSP24_53010 [Streptomyces spinoverrucosus]|uniref:Uncharacterized protein n=1 Tax=Streptomyces spinoverrucosus TaxID=284043 RepID=A0A4Y3VRR9_9ACTN|nr:hypothetical protein [Streptomyces spinoverrucosus]GEC07646.1 hypothetical protein SSP24_53010 [Streptomyces spinoverrucosus]GHB62208.1 hypothetical protein GCM10010397_35250 [Streptomyces spinoverrucosus]
MAHAAPAPGARPPGAPVPATRPSTAPATRTPDLFSPRTHAIARWAVPVSVGLLYGYWAAANDRGGGPITGWNVLFGFVTALAFVVLYAAVREGAKRLRRGAHALAWAAFWGVAFGFLYNQTGYSVLRSAAMSVVIAGVVAAVLFYRYYTHEATESA